MRSTVTGSTQQRYFDTPNSKIHVAFLYGGLSNEREVSMMSMPGLLEALLENGYKVTPIDMGNDIAIHLAQIKPDIVYNGLYGTYGEDGCLPGLLEIMGIKYTHSGVLSSSVGFNKIFSGALFRDHGIQCARRKVISKEEKIVTDPMPRPYVIKPISEGSSVGVILVFEEDDFNFADYKWEYGDQIIVEEYIPGQEIQVAMLGEKAIGAIEVRPLHRRFYDYDSKYKDNMTEHIMPAAISQEAYQRVLVLAEKAHKLIGCRSVSRVDFRYNQAQGVDGLYILEVNTHPGMTPLSLVPEICAYAGITYNQLVNKIIQDAL